LGEFIQKGGNTGYQRKYLSSFFLITGGRNGVRTRGKKAWGGHRRGVNGGGAKQREANRVFIREEMGKFGENKANTTAKGNVQERKRGGTGRRGFWCVGPEVKQTGNRGKNVKG